MHRTVAAALTIICLTGTGVGVVGCVTDDDGPARVTLLSRAPERGNWKPQTIRATVGRELAITIRNVDVVTHSFYLPAFRINTGPIKPGETREVVFTPQERGEYLFTCGIWCSDYHMYERGTLIVE